MSTSSLPSATSGQPTSSSTPSFSPILSSQAALYLYTFLVTLVVLITLSAVIVIRSCLIRRRHQRLMEEAIRNGTYIPPVNTKRSLGDKPLVHDLYLFNNGEERLEEACWWERLMPVSATIATSNYDSDSPSHIPSTSPPPVVPVAAPVDRRQHWYTRRRRNMHEPPSSESTQEPPSTVPKPESLSSTRLPDNTLTDGQTVCVAVFIAMPMPPDLREQLKQIQTYHEASSSTTSTAMELPQLNFGISEITLQGEDDLSLAS